MGTDRAILATPGNGPVIEPVIVTPHVQKIKAIVYHSNSSPNSDKHHRSLDDSVAAETSVFRA